jgi:hypothetical protein
LRCAERERHGADGRGEQASGGGHGIRLEIRKTCMYTLAARYSSSMSRSFITFIGGRASFSFSVSGTAPPSLSLQFMGIT